MEKVSTPCIKQYWRAFLLTTGVIQMLLTPHISTAQDISGIARTRAAFATTQSELYLHQYQKTLHTAQIRAWPLRLDLGLGRSMSLQRTDGLGQPVYYTTHNTPLSVGTHTTALYEGGVLNLKLSGNSSNVKSKIALWDGGNVRTDHRELSGKIKQSDAQPTASANDHATHMAGILVARGLYQPVKGMAYGAELQAWNFNNDLSEIVQQAPNLLISNHAYGPVAGWMLDVTRPGSSNDEKWEWWGTPSVHETQDYRFGFYDESVGEVDRITYNFPYFLMVRSADNKRVENGPPAGMKYYLKNTDVQSTLPRSRNDTYDVIPGEANAKNVLTIGAADLRNTTFQVTPYSGWGPTDDGRIKPDLLGVGTQVMSSVGTDTDAYGVLTGTSMASANVSGSLLLLQELYQQQNSAFMLSSTLKGLALHTADKPAGKTAPSYEYGWGLLNAEKAARVILNSEGKHLLAEQVLQQGGTFTQKFVANGTEPLIVTICWTDPEAAPVVPGSSTVNSPSPRLVNDLDMKMAEGFNNYQPWVLDPAAPAQPARTGNNFRDNVEQVYIANPFKGRVYTLTVSHKNNLKNSRQPFALIASGLEKPDCALVASLSPGTDTTLCPGQTLTLAANTGTNYTYQWLREGAPVAGATDWRYQATESGVYQVRIAQRGCTVVSGATRVAFAPVKATLEPAVSAVICNGKAALLQAPQEKGYAYTWFFNNSPLTGATAATLQAVGSGRYAVEVRNGGCRVRSTDVVVQQVVVVAVIAPPAITQIPPGASISLKANYEIGNYYEWYRDAVLMPQETAPLLAATEGGAYKVVVQNSGCAAESATVLLWGGAQGTSSLITGLALSADSSQVLILYPNPTHDLLTVSVRRPGLRLASSAVITTAQGQSLISQPLILEGDHLETRFDLKNLAVGTYLIQVRVGENSFTEHFVKQ